MVVIDLGGGVAPVDVEEVKSWARIARDDEDELLTLLIAAANAAIEAEVGLVLARRPFRLIVEDRPDGGRIRPPRPPIASVDAVSGFRFDGGETVFDPARHATLSQDGLSFVLSDQVWFESPNGVDITVTAGYAPEDVPATAKHAMLVAVSSWFETRTEVDGGAGQIPSSGALRLVRSLKRVRI
ncbi:head-tail connector protein [Fulvimarina sp. MAC3]|uniref:head-tail connector protein n=1 Tax=Fulvimarina sp. MAC3 TaxID=3148887 RepID=UPI0031FC540C